MPVMRSPQAYICNLWSGRRYLLLSVGFELIFVDLFWLPEARESL